MVTLANIQGQTLVPDLTAGLRTALKAFGTPATREDRQRRIAKEDEAAAGRREVQNLVAGLDDPSAKKSPNQTALLRIATIDPGLATKLQGIIGTGIKEAREVFRLTTERGLKESAFISGQPDLAGKQRAIRSLIAAKTARGESTEGLIGFLNLPETALDVELNRQKILGTNAAILTKAAPEQFEDVRDAQGNIIGQRNVATGRLVGVPPAVSPRARGLASAVTKIFPSGESIQALPSGEVAVRNREGRLVSGEERLNVLKQAQKSELELTRATAGEKAAGAAAISRSEKAIDSLSKIKTSIFNIDEAIRLLKAGAQTGPILSRLPSIRAASVALDNVQKAMGLDVIGTTTFGALSTGELDLALSKALPTRLKPDALLQWLIDKKAAQEKLASFLENAAIFLGIPGNTSADFVAVQRELRQQQTGRVLNFDAQGRQIQ